MRYRYYVESDVPLALISGIGNSPAIVRAEFQSLGPVWQEQQNGPQARPCTIRARSLDEDAYRHGYNAGYADGEAGDAYSETPR